MVATGGSLATDPTRLDIAVTEDDAVPVPVLPLAGQLLLAALLALGGRRRYRRR